MKIAFILLTLLLIALTNICIAQPDTLWTKTYGGINYDWGYTVQQTSDSGYIILGYSNSFSSDLDFWLLKTDSNGDTTWTHRYGGIDDDQGWSVQQTLDGGYILSGHTESFGAGEEDLYLIKTDTNGDTAWTKTYGNLDDDKFFVVRQTLDQGYIILGQTRIIGTGNDDLWLLKTDVNGDTVWTKTYGDSLDNGVGGIDVTADSGFILTLTFESYPTYDENILLIKTDQFGDTIWTKIYGGIDDESVTSNSVKQTTDGGYIIFASTQSRGAGSEDIWLIKTDANGDSSWSKTFGGQDDDVSMGGLQTLDGGYLIFGRTSSYGAGDVDIWLIKTDSNGNLLWTKTMGGIDYDIGMSVQQTFDGGYIITGATRPITSNFTDLWLIRLATDPSMNITQNGEFSISAFNLKQNYPNPFNPITTIEFSLPKAEYVTLKIYNLLGQAVITLVSEHLSRGIHNYTWDASNFSSGVYHYKIESNNFTKTKKLLLIK